MKRITKYALLCSTLLLAVCVHAEPPEIIGYESDGTIIFSSSSPSNFFSLEFTGSLTDPAWTNWGSVTDQPITGSVMRLPSPMFFRIREASEQLFHSTDAALLSADYPHYPTLDGETNWFEVSEHYFYTPRGIMDLRVGVRVSFEHYGGAEVVTNHYEYKLNIEDTTVAVWTNSYTSDGKDPITNMKYYKPQGMIVNVNTQGWLKAEVFGRDIGLQPQTQVKVQGFHIYTCNRP